MERLGFSEEELGQFRQGVERVVRLEAAAWTWVGREPLPLSRWLIEHFSPGAAMSFGVETLPDSSVDELILKVKWWGPEEVYSARQSIPRALILETKIYPVEDYLARILDGVRPLPG